MSRRRKQTDVQFISAWFLKATPDARQVMLDVIHGILNEAEPRPDRKTRADAGTTRKPKEAQHVSAASN